MGSHDKMLTFIVAPRMEWPLVLGLTWLRKWNPIVNWKRGSIRFQGHVTFADEIEENHGKA